MRIDKVIEENLTEILQRIGVFSLKVGNGYVRLPRSNPLGVLQSVHPRPMLQPRHCSPELVRRRVADARSTSHPQKGRQYENAAS